MPAGSSYAARCTSGPRSLVVVPSLSGTTTESVEALRWCRERGACVITLTGFIGVPLADEADVNLVNEAADDTSCESFYLQALLVALSLVHLRGEYNGYAETLAQLTTLPALLLEAKRAFEPRAAEYAASIRDERFHIITGAGATWPQAFYYGMCILEEMQWIRTRPVHASDFFPRDAGELVEAGVRVILLKGEDASAARRACGEVRPGYTEKVWVLDSADVPARRPSGGALARVPGRARRTARTDQRPPRGPARPPADDRAGGVLTLEEDDADPGLDQLERPVGRSRTRAPVGSGSTASPRGCTCRSRRPAARSAARSGDDVEGARPGCSRRTPRPASSNARFASSSRAGSVVSCASVSA